MVLMVPQVLQVRRAQRESLGNLASRAMMDSVERLDRRVITARRGRRDPREWLELAAQRALLDRWGCPATGSTLSLTAQRLRRRP